MGAIKTQQFYSARAGVVPAIVFMEASVVMSVSSVWFTALRAHFFTLMPCWNPKLEMSSRKYGPNKRYLFYWRRGVCQSPCVKPSALSLSDEVKNAAEPSFLVTQHDHRHFVVFRFLIAERDLGRTQPQEADHGA